MKGDRRGTNTNPVVPRLGWNVFPRRMPLAVMKDNVRTVMVAVFPSGPNQLFPAPSAPAGQRMSDTVVKPASFEDGADMAEALIGMGTREEEKGVAPAENGTLGLFVPLRAVEPFPTNEVMKEPAKNRLLSEELDVMESTRPSAPTRPLKGGGDQEAALGSQTATEVPGEVKLPPTQSLVFLVSQYTASMTPFGPPEPSAANAPEEGVYDAMFVAGVPAIEEKEPAK